MSLLYRLRRSVALFICPEMGVEDRLKAMRSDFGMLAAAVPASSPLPAGLAGELGLDDQITYAAFMATLVGYHFRPEHPTFNDSYRYASKIAQDFGWPVPAHKKARRWITPQRALRVSIPDWDRDPAFEAAVKQFAEDPANCPPLDFDGYIYWDGRDLRFVRPERLSARFRFRAPPYASHEPRQSADRQSPAARRGNDQELGIAERLYEAFGHVKTADNSWQAMLDVLAERRERNLQLGGDDKEMSLAIAMQVGRFSLPVAEAGSK